MPTNSVLNLAELQPGMLGIKPVIRRLSSKCTDNYSKAVSLLL